MFEEKKDKNKQETKRKIFKILFTIGFIFCLLILLVLFSIAISCGGTLIQGIPELITNILHPDIQGLNAVLSLFGLFGIAALFAIWFIPTVVFIVLTVICVKFCLKYTDWSKNKNNDI